MCVFLCRQIKAFFIALLSKVMEMRSWSDSDKWRCVESKIFWYLCSPQIRFRYRVSQKKCNIAIFSLNLFQRSDYTFSHVFRNQNSEPVSSKRIKHPSRIWSALKTPKTHAHGTGDPRSPDLNPLDYGSRFCLKQKSIEYSGIWGKSRLFSPRPQTLKPSRGTHDSIVMTAHAFLVFLIFWMGMFKVFRWNGLKILIPKHLWKSIIGPLEQI